MSKKWEMLNNDGVWTVRDKKDHNTLFNFTKEEFAKEFKKLLKKTF